MEIVQQNLLFQDEEEEEEILGDRSIYEGTDGTRWNLPPPQGILEDWRFVARDFGDGPTSLAANPELDIEATMKLFLSLDIIQDICKWTNKYGAYLVKEWNKGYPAKPRTWEKTDPIEMYSFIGLLILAGVDKPHKKPWKELWSRDESVSTAV